MKSLLDPAARLFLETRVRALTPEHRPLWGRMTVNQMLCHLNDSFRFALGERAMDAPPPGLAQRTLVKWIALSAPVPWPKGVPTRPEMDQTKGGTPPVGLEPDRAALLELIDRFCARRPSDPGPRHPIFGPMTHREWMRWGYLHVDHHLRQFGA